MERTLSGFPMLERPGTLDENSSDTPVERVWSSVSRKMRILSDQLDSFADHLDSLYLQAVCCKGPPPAQLPCPKFPCQAGMHEYDIGETVASDPDNDFKFELGRQVARLGHEAKFARLQIRTLRFWGWVCCGKLKAVIS